MGKQRARDDQCCARDVAEWDVKSGLSDIKA